MKSKSIFFALIAALILFPCCSKKESVQYDANDIYQVARYGDSKSVEKAVKAGLSVNERDADGFTPIFHAVLGEPKIYADALEAMVAAFKKNDDGAVYGALKSAVLTKGNSESVKALLKNGANISLNDRNGHSVFLYASLFCTDTGILEQLISAGADVKETITINQPQSIMAFASFINTSPDVISFLAKKTGGASEANAKGTSPIMWAAMYNSNPAVIDALIKEGADINDSRHQSGKSPLDWAKECNTNENVVQHIADIGGVSLLPKFSAADIGKKENREITVDGKKQKVTFTLISLEDYDKSGNKTKTTKKDSIIKYNDKGDIIQETYPNNHEYDTSWEYDYDKNGRKTYGYEISSYGVTRNAYNEHGDITESLVRAKEFVESYGLRSSYVWKNDFGEMDDLSYNYTYDQQGRIILQRSSNNRKISYSYNIDGTLASKTTKDGPKNGVAYWALSTDTCTYGENGKLMQEQEKELEWYRNPPNADDDGYPTDESTNPDSTSTSITQYDYDYYDTAKKQPRTMAVWKWEKTSE